MICWNVAKASVRSDFKEYMKSLILKEDINLLLLQEVKMEHKEEYLEDFSYILSANMQTKKHIYGVMSAFKADCSYEKSILSLKRELSLLTHKSSLLSIHELSDGKEILIVNIHAINFVTFKSFEKELGYIQKQLSSFKGALIVAGDFNTWSKKRAVILKRFVANLSLRQIDFNTQEMKKFFGNTLDHVMYRNLSVKCVKVIKDDIFSDHNPMIVKFVYET